RKMSFVKGTTAVLVGSVFYKACIQVAISLGLPANLMKLATAVLFLLVLVLGNRQKGGAENA
ncbi:MAG: ABC transporter permease, partial [Anaerotignum sp.]|nr:ABC transporter permease [Anaerotignum sp.]